MAQDSAYSILRGRLRTHLEALACLCGAHVEPHDRIVQRLALQAWQRRWAQSRCRCGSGEPSPSADLAGLNPVLVQMWQG